MGTTTFLPPVPPVTENDDLNIWLNDLFNYITEIHKTLYGLSDDSGEVDNENSPGFHDGRTGSHEDLIQAEDAGDNSQSTLSVAADDADITYGSEEQGLINSIKNILNAHIGESNNNIVNDNEHKQNLRNANIIG